jgi:hypothetical protein
MVNGGFPAGIVTFPAKAVSLPTTIECSVLAIVTFPADVECLPVAASGGPASIASLPAGIECRVLTIESPPAGQKRNKSQVFGNF